jgi:cardiolipin synthase
MEMITNIISSPVMGILAVVYFITIVFLCLMIILENRAPVQTLSWVVVILLVPFIGIIIYFILGQNFRKKKIYSRKAVIDSEYLFAAAGEQRETLKEKLRNKTAAVREKSHLMTLMLNNEKAMLSEHNSLDLLLNASETFPAMLAAIEGATKYIHLEFFRFDVDPTGNVFRHSLMKKAREGVEVRVIIDDVGSWSFKAKYINEMRAAGVEIFPFHPVRFPFLANKINYRNHRKILVVDGKKGYIGGLNIAEKYLRGLKDLGPWRDTHMEIRGEAVASMNMVFLIDWYFVSKIVLTREKKYFDVESVDGNKLVQLATSGPDSDYANIMQVYFSAMSTARECIYLCTPYFSPNESILTALKTAALGGVDVRILLPGKSDSPIGNWNSRSYISELLEAGVRVYLYSQGFNHSKFMIVDRVFSSVGSPNVDMRSFLLNFEVTALVYDEEFSEKLEKVFMNDLQSSNEVLSELWSGRKKSEKYKESLSRILGPLY